LGSVAEEAVWIGLNHGRVLHDTDMKKLTGFSWLAVYMATGLPDTENSI